MGVPATTAAGLLREMGGMVGTAGTVGAATPAVGDGAGALNALPLESLTQAESVRAAPTRTAAPRARAARTRETLGIAGRTSSGAAGGAACRPTGPQYTGYARSPQCPTQVGCSIWTSRSRPEPARRRRPAVPWGRHRSRGRPPGHP